MDYKYIEQLIERYWNCETSQEEEQILRSFFSQKDVPAHLLRYKDFFSFENNEKEISLGEDFDRKLLAEIEKPTVKAHRISIYRRMMPMFKAAAAIAIVVLLGKAAQSSFNHSADGSPQTTQSYHETYSDPKQAYDHVSSALKIVSETMNESAASDSDSIVINSKVNPHTKTLDNN